MNLIWRAVLNASTGLFIGSYACVCYAADARQPLELAWFSDTNSQLNALSQQAVDCVKTLDDARFSLGRLAFNSPRLLGGQAGRMGLSCASCHPAGRSNRDFFIKQISDRPGSADVSHHFLSSLGGDNVSNPKPIPDLADLASLRFKNRKGASFDNLLTRLIEVEFDGQPPTIEVFDALKLYLGQNNVENCDSSTATVERNLQSEWSLIDDGLDALSLVSRAGNSNNIRFVTQSMRAILDTVYRFYSIAQIEPIDEQLISISRRLAVLANEESSNQRRELISRLRHSLATLKDDLVKHQSRSFYNRAVALSYLQERASGGFSSSEDMQKLGTK